MKIINRFNQILLASSLSAALIFSSCKKDDNPTPAHANTITDVVYNDARYIVLKE